MSVDLTFFKSNPNNILRVKRTGSSRSHVIIDFVKNNKSLLSGKEYNVKDYESIMCYSVSPNIDELKYYLKNKKKNDYLELNDKLDHFYIARALKLPIAKILEKDKDKIVKSFYKIYISFLKQYYVEEQDLKRIKKTVSNISDFSILLQYLPYDSEYKNGKKRVIVLDRIRKWLYSYFYPGCLPFIELYDKELIWAQNIMQTLLPLNLEYAYLNIGSGIKFDEAKDIWRGLIRSKYETAIKLLSEEEAEAKEIDDQETILEINLLREKLKTVVEALRFDSVKSIQELIMFWPEELSPGPQITIDPVGRSLVFR